MANIELVIKMPEEDYETLINTNDSRTTSMIARRNLYKALKKGTPLPKGHGALKDADRILNCKCKNNFSECDTCLDSELCALLNEAPTIIKEDKEEGK